MGTTTVRVEHLITDVDMRPTRALISGRFKVFNKLGRGQIALLLNKRCTIARFIDSASTIHTMYAPDGEKFDVNTIETMVRDRTFAIGVSVVRNANLQPKRVTGLSVEKISKKKVRKVRRKKRAAA